MTENNQKIIAKQICTQYLKKEKTTFDELKELDAKVKRPAYIISIILAVFGAIIMGSGMSLIMTDISKTIGINNSLIWGVIIGLIGMLIVIIDYPIYKAVLKLRRKKYADEIVTLSDEIMKG